MDNLEYYYNSIPCGKENAVSYAELCEMWGTSVRKAREILHELSLFDPMDDMILIRSSSGKGFYRTDDLSIIEAYKKECTNKAKSNFAPLKKINRVLKSTDNMQMNFYNNLKSTRLAKDMKQVDVVNIMRTFDKNFDVALLSKFENSVCIPTPYQLCLLARIYACKPSELINYETCFEAI